MERKSFHRLPLSATYKRRSFHAASLGRETPAHGGSYFRKLTHQRPNCSEGQRLHWPSEAALAGSGCTSTKTPSAPAATPARAIGSTNRARPVPCDGSTITGRWVSSARSGTTRGREVPRRRIERTDAPARTARRWDCPPATVLGGHEPLVDGGRETALEQHRLAPTPAARRSAKFCMLRAPICSMSAYAATAGLRADRALRSPPPGERSAAPRAVPGPAPSPWNAYGDVRGLNAPPRSTFAPAPGDGRGDRLDLLLGLDRARARADAEHVAPKPAPSRRRTTVRSGRASRRASLSARKGAVDGPRSWILPCTR